MLSKRTRESISNTSPQGLNGEWQCPVTMQHKRLGGRRLCWFLVIANEYIQQLPPEREAALAKESRAILYQSDAESDTATASFSFERSSGVSLGQSKASCRAPRVVWIGRALLEIAGAVG